MPKDAEPHYQLALAYLDLADVRAAVAALRQAIELDPKHVGAQLRMAELMTASRNKELIAEAAARLEAIVSTSPENFEANDLLAVAEWRLGQGEAASKRLEELLAKVPGHLRSSVNLARMKLGRGDLSGAGEVLERAAAIAPESAAAALSLGQFYMLANLPEKAEPEVRRALKLDARNASALVALGSMQLAAKQLDQAEATYRQLASLGEKQFQHAHAAFMYQTGKRSEAVAEFEKLAAADRTDNAARARLLAAYVLMDKIPEAQRLLADALKRNPRDSDALFHRGELYLKLGKATEAEADLREVLRLKPDSSEAHFTLARVLQVTGMTKISRQELGEALRLAPDFLAARLLLARSYLKDNMPKPALDVLEQAPERQKGLLPLVLEHNWTLLALGRTPEVKARLDAAKTFGRQRELTLQEAMLKMRERDYPGARARAEEALAENPEDVRAAKLVAESYEAQKQAGAGLGRLRQLAEARPQSAALQLLLGQWHMRANNPVEARKAFEASKAADAGYLPADLALADLDRSENRLDAARRRTLGILAIDAKSVPALTMLAQIEEAGGNRAEAITHYRTILQNDSSSILARNNLAYHLAWDDPDEALSLALEVIGMAPDNAAVRDTLGWIYYRQRNYKAAIAYLKGAVEIESTPRRNFHLAMSYLKGGNRELGQKILQTALREDPQLPQKEKGW
jgi:tetratricopeptide (TPR) repeat protein